MTDETHIYYADVRTKAQIARSSHNRRTHRGGRKFMSDKEIEKMSSEVTTYNLNEPMTYRQFASMPADIQQQYINNLQDRFRAPQCKIAEMLGVSNGYFNKRLNESGITTTRFGRTTWDEDGFNAWRNGGEDADVDVLTAEPATTPMIPQRGEIAFRGSVNAALQAAAALLGGADAKITIWWEVDNYEQT